MKILSIETQIRYIPLKTPFITALRRVENVEFVRVALRCENGFAGIGEAPSTKAITGEDLEDILNSINSIKTKLISHMPKEALKIVHKSKMGSSAEAALDMALVSLIAQEKGLELYRYLGTKKATVLKTDLTISLNDSHAMLKDATLACGDGLDILKIKLGKDIYHAITVTKQISKTLPHAKLLIDANQAWSVEGCLEFLEALKGVKIELIEQPVVASDIEGLKQITQHSHIPIVADEAVFSLEDAKKIIESKSADIINIKLMKCGGITKAVEILEYAREKKVKCMMGSMLEGPYSINVALHLVLAYCDIISFIDLDSLLLYKQSPKELDFEFNKNEIKLKIYTTNKVT
jgi:L-alanine-DL-glutamate epimerase-like enolase superfamily enzyme